MGCKCPKADAKVLFWIVVLLCLIILLLDTFGCYVNTEKIESIPRTTVNKTCRVFMNHWACSDAEFINYAKYMTPTGWTEMRVLYWYGHYGRRGRVNMVVFYYE